MIATHETPKSFTTKLGIRGWAAMEPALLASLATQAPLLLIGPHGTGKSQLIEATAQALGQPYRHYNASLINYDDLIGIPMPNADGTGIEFIKSEATIWSAGFVFLDEISRCRADLQNKLFPIIHERRVVGIQLPELEHRWAAMNPPASEELDTASATGDYYIGSEPLDPALSDRFPYIIPVPGWAQLSKEDRRALVRWSGTDAAPDDEMDLPGIVAEIAARIPELEATFQDWLDDYVVCLVDLLEQNGLPQSPRRARMLARSVIAVHAARTVVEGDDADIEESAQLAVWYGLPQMATDTPPAEVKVVAIHKQAWELTQYMENDAWRQVIDEQDPARRVVLADELGFDDEDMSRLITHTLGTEEDDLRQMGLATAMFLKFSTERNLDPSAFEPLAQLAYHLLEPRVRSYTLQPNTTELNLWNGINNWITRQGDRIDSPLFRIQRNLLLYGFPELWGKADWGAALRQLTDDMKLFGITDEE